MAITHFQFKSIHPFYDGNGRSGRIINILYLVLKELMDIPVLYLSRYIIENKADYYELIQAVRDNSSYEAWVVWILKGVEQNENKKYLTSIDPHYPKVFKDVLERNVDVEELQYIPTVFEYIGDLEVVCSSCHKKIHKINKQSNYVI